MLGSERPAVPTLRDHSVPARQSPWAASRRREIQALNRRRYSAFFRSRFAFRDYFRLERCVAPYLQTPRTSIEVRQYEPMFTDSR